ncbi:MAG: hypothetical protein ACOYO1_19650 [Bacteroidales bacterium]
MTRNFLQMFFKGALIISAASIIFAGCAKDGSDGLVGPAGANGKDASETCKLCHNPSVVDSVATQFQLSKHEFGPTAEEEAGNVGCTPCHCQEAFKYVCKNNISAIYYQDSLTGPWKNPYNSIPTATYGKLGCFTCHSSLHTTYGYSDLTSLTTVAPVQMTMWGGTKTIDLTQDGGQSNLCVKCHQPRPVGISGTYAGSNALIPASLKGRWLDYPTLAANPTAVFYDTALASTVVQAVTPSYRTHIHYGAVGGVVAGKGGVEFGTGYTNSAHAIKASCQDCHMAPMTGAAGGHSFKAKGNFNGCNTSLCHTAAGSTTGTGTGIMTSSHPDFTTVRNDIKTLIATLAGKLKEGGVEIMNKNPDATTNLWYGYTAGNYDGYLNVYDPINNPTGLTNNTSSFRYMGSTSSWTTAQKATNLTLPKLHLTNAQMGAIINFQFAVREYSLGIHNYKYIKTLLTNSIALL